MDKGFSCLILIIWFQKHESEQHDEVPSLFALKQNPAANGTLFE